MAEEVEGCSNSREEQPYGPRLRQEGVGVERVQQAEGAHSYPIGSVILDSRSSWILVTFVIFPV